MLSEFEKTGLGGLASEQSRPQVLDDKQNCCHLSLGKTISNLPIIKRMQTKTLDKNKHTFSIKQIDDKQKE